MSSYFRYLMLAAGTLAMALIVAVLGSGSILNEPARSTAAIAQYITISGSIALGLGVLSVVVGMRYLPRISLKVAVAYGVGSLGAIFTVAYTPLLMFKDRHDVNLLVLLLVCFMVISIGLGSIIAFGLAQHVNALREAARRVAAGQFDTRVEVPSGDELSELAEAFNRMSAELGVSFDREKAIEEGRRELIAAISHDLRTPLASIRAMLEAVQDGVVRDEPTISRYHAAIHDQVDRLSRLIDDLFELSRLDSGSISLRIQYVDFDELVLETVESLRPSAERRGIRLTVTEDSVGHRARVDADQVQRVVANLVQNAIRHTPDGGKIQVAIRADRQELAVEVVDSGDGIPGGDLERIFDRFYRGEKARTRSDSTGAGLGLAIAKAIVEAHRGRIWAESPPHQGARFVFTVPSA